MMNGIPLYHFKKHGQYRDGFKYTTHTYAFISSLGVGFSRKGDEIYWIWPWKRKRFNHGKPWSVVTLNYWAVDTLAEVDKFWREHFDFRIKCQEDEVEAEYGPRNGRD